MTRRAICLSAALSMATLAPAMADDASFAHLGHQALSYNAELAASRHNLSAEQEELTLARSAFYPHFSLAANRDWEERRTEQEKSVKTHTETLQLQLNQQIFNKESARIYDSAKYLTEARQQDYRAAEQSLLLDVLEARLELHQAIDLTLLLERRLEATREQLRATRRREQEGLSAYLEVAHAEAELESVRADWVAAQDRRLAAQEALRVLTGVEAATLPQLREDFILHSPPPLPQLRVQMAANNPALDAARKQEQVLWRRLKAAEAATFPTVDLIVSHSRLNNGRGLSEAGLRLQAPLYSGGELSGRIRQATFRHQSGQLAALDLNRRLSEALRAAYQDATSAITQQRALRSAVAARRLSLEKTRAAWREGVALSAEVLEAEEELFDAELRLRVLNYNYLLSLSQIQNFIGGIDNDYLKKLDDFFNHATKEEQ